ncbi:uncharacterized protein EV422DRAFT_563882 [Fimicolochytrium jonesii]|uniref:uncharacterized protein n=1 Tax=Fimicolochytrium jonesii TaxID=1396493 RepID=UPI0022FE7128|nr:uncharacterized protein EV422DRAFT_563882 [Fimicolochytrium jonesii]KAI8826073.1 hypothetical protein EV422DRAFT_563882 [Fimicolochytrium jonesii]
MRCVGQCHLSNRFCSVFKLIGDLEVGLQTHAELEGGCAVSRTITNILEENVVQPLLVSTSAINLAAETVKMIMKIDDIVAVR